ncbi:tail needle knob [Salmonella phage Se-G]|uniref:Sf6-type phage tail needle knob domain-containing protein n=2 Tax=Kuttervirus PM10 TaxID=2169809 RepID=A0A6G6XQR4_9CAUD|nr:tail needle knob [Salmonella phage Se-G]AXF41685.1 tail needle and knob protein [Salmonella phage vB_SalM-LPST94]QIG60383.1 hypothetical protein chennai_018 [Salmonella phage Chennai]UNI71367.1 phage_tail_NK domain-containing protein [Salmonella phage vB_SenA_SM5]URQ08928.1 hypothetical protein BRM13312_00101 [Salmonella phage BRM 13312]
MPILTFPIMGNMFQTKRVKSEVRFTGLSLNIPTGTTGVDLLSLFVGKTPVAGSTTMAPFFDLSANKFKVFNNDSTVTLKINLIGSWQGTTNNRTLEINFVGSVGNQLTKSRDAALTGQDILSFPTFFSVDKNGNLATNGSQIIARSYGNDFTITEAIFIAEQMVPLYMNSI